MMTKSNNLALLKQANHEAISILLDNIVVNYSVIDREGNYIAQNESMIESISFGNKKAWEVDKASWEHCVQVMNSKKDCVTKEQFKDRTFLSIKRPIINDGRATAIVVLSVDISKEARADEVRKRILRNLSHDIATPFTGIETIAELLKDEETDTRKKELLEIIYNSSHELRKFLQDMIRFANVKYNGQSNEMVEFSLEELMQSVFKLMQSELKRKKLNMQLVMKDGLPSVKTDKFKLQKIVLSLVDNAIKFTDQGGITVGCDVEKKNGKQSVNISVKDTGIGIPRDQQGEIYDDFNRLTYSDTATQYKGKGIGLSLVREFINDLNGKIMVNSEVNKGSTFTVSIPIAC